jgi:hypothetical protein
MELKTRYKYVHFESPEEEQKHSRWMVVNNKSGALLAWLKWYSGWRQYCFYPLYGTMFSHSCLADIVNFIKQLEKKK